MARNRIVINFDNQVSDAPGGAAYRRRSSRRGVVRVLMAIAVLLLLIIGGLAGGGYFWWRHYQSSPAYALALLVDATQRNDKQAIDGILDTDKIATDFVSQIRARVQPRRFGHRKSTWQRCLHLPRLKRPCMINW